MRLGGFISLALHVGFAVAGMIAAPYLASEESSSMMILPVDLEIADSTNLKPVTEDVSEEDKAAEAPEVESFASAAPPPPPAEAEEILPDEETKPDPKKPDPKKPEANAPPAPKKQEAPESALLGDILKDVNRNASATRAEPAPKPSMRGVPDAGPQKGAGNMSKDSATIADIIMSQLLARRCWGDQDDMADARRLGAVIAIRFDRSGRVSKMELIEPRSRPTNDPPLQVFIQRAYDAINKCNTQGFQVPAKYYEYNPPLVIELNFRP